MTLPSPGDSAPPRAFGDVLVADLSVYPGGALAAMHLAEFGARVVRASPPAFAADVALSLYANRNKRAVAIDDGAIAELVGRADVVVVDRTAAQLAADGLSREVLRGRDPALIHAWLPPHAPRGAARELPADELLLQAWTGMADQQPGATSDHPVAPVVPILAYEHGALGATAIAAALFARARDGEGRSLTVSGLHAVAAMNSTIMLDLPGIFRPFGAQKDGTGVSPQYRMYQCRDRRWVFICALTPGFFFKLLDALDLMELMTMPGVDGEFRRLLDPEIQKLAAKAIAESIATRDLAAWARIFDAAGVPYAPVQSRDVWAASETVTEDQLLFHTRHRDLGEVVLPGLPVELAATPGCLDDESPEEIGGSEIRTRDVVDRPRTGDVTRLPLDGILAIDATKYVAGPFASLLLQDLGATVIKVDPVGGEDFRIVAGASFSAINRDKAQVGLDLADRADQDAFYALVRRADVLVENMSGRVVDELGVDTARFRAENTQLVHCHLEAWGAGPLEDTPGFDPLLQARSGLMAAQGGIDTPVIQASSVHDIGSGTLAAFGVVAALYARCRRQIGDDVRMSLSRSSIAFQGAEFTTFVGRPEPTSGHLDYLGDGPHHRLYSCTDGWVAIGATSATSRAALDRVTGEIDAREAFFAAKPVQSVLEVCADAGVPAVRVLPRKEIYTSLELTDNEFFLTIHDEELGAILAVRGFSDWDTIPPRRHAQMRPAGADTDAVLQRD